MAIDKIIAALPTKSPAERVKIRFNAMEKLGSTNLRLQGEAKQVIDALDEIERKERVALAAAMSELDVTERIMAAFTALPLTETEISVIQVLLDFPNSTSAELSQHLQWGGQAWHMHFGLMCEKRASYLWPAPDAQSRSGKFYSGILVNLKEPENRFSIKPEVAVALSSFGLVTHR